MPENQKSDTGTIENMSSKRKALCAVAILICGFAYWATRYKSDALLPVIAGDLNGLLYYTWAPMVFSLTGAISAPFWGKMGDIYGKRNILMVLLLLMAAGEVFCMFSPNIWWFIIGYAVNGFGAGAMQGTYLALLGDLFPPTQRGKIGGSIMGIMSIVQLSLPTVAALIAERWSWRYVFVLTGVIFILAFLCVMFIVPNIKKPNTDKRIDIPGVIMLAISVPNFLIALSWVGTKSWTSPIVIGMLAIAVVVFVLFLFHEGRIPEYSIVSTKLLKNRSYLMCCIITVCMTFGLTGVATFLSLFVQGVMGVSATIYSTIAIPASFVGIFMGTFAGFLMDKTKHYKWMLVLAPTATVVTMIFFGLMPATIMLGSIVVARIFYSVCGGSWMPTINTLSAMSYVDSEDYGVGNGTLFFFTSMGNALSPALLGSILNGIYKSTIARNITSLNLSSQQIKMVSTARALVDKKTLFALKATFSDPNAYQSTLSALKISLESSLHTVFFVAAGFIFIGVVAALFLKEIPLDQVQYKAKFRKIPKISLDKKAD